MGLIYISKFHGIPYTEMAFFGFLTAHDQPEKSSFPGSVWPDNSNDPCRGQSKAQVFIKQFISEGFGNAVNFDNQVAEPGAIGDI